MIGRFLASTAVAGVLFTGAAMAQMSAPPPNNAPSGQPAPMQTQNPTPRDQLGQAGGGTMPSDSSSSSMSRSDKSSMTRGSGDSMRRTGQKAKGRSKQTAQGHNMDNIADQLNACQARPQAERQSCIDQATRM